MGIAESLAIILIILKILGVLTWSWLLVLIPVLFAIVIYMIVWSVWLFYYLKLKQERDI